MRDLLDLDLDVIDTRITLAEFWWCGEADDRTWEAARGLATDAAHLLAEVRRLRDVVRRKERRVNVLELVLGARR